MTDRMEIPKRIKLIVWQRAGGGTKLGVSCEGCGLRLGKKDFQYDHTFPEWLRVASKEQREAIKPGDVKLLGVECCHKPKTAIEAGERSKDYAVLEKEARVKPKSKRGIRGWKKFDGTPVFAKDR